MNTSPWQFENLVREYVAGQVDWEAVHQYAVQLEYENKAQFPPGRELLNELHLIFLTADEKDDPQFRADRTEIAALLSRLDAIHHPIQ